MTSLQLFACVVVGSLTDKYDQFNMADKVLWTWPTTYDQPDFEYDQKKLSIIVYWVLHIAETASKQWVTTLECQERLEKWIFTLHWVKGYCYLN